MVHKSKLAFYQDQPPARTDDEGQSDNAFEFNGIKLPSSFAGKSKHWLKQNICKFRQKPYASWSVQAMAVHLNTTKYTVRRWIALGLLPAEYDAETEKWWIPEPFARNRPYMRNAHKKYYRLRLAVKNSDRYVSIQRAGQMLGCSGAAVVRLVANGELAAISRANRRYARRIPIRISLEEIRRFINTKLVLNPAEVDSIYCGPHLSPRIAAVTMCHACRYWQQADFPRPGWGRCSLFSDPDQHTNPYPPETQAPLAVPVDARGFPANIFTHPNFACRQADLVPTWDNSVGPTPYRRTKNQ